VGENDLTAQIQHSMADTSQPGAARADQSAGHLSVYVEGAHPAEVPFQFALQPRRLGWSMVGTLVFDALFLGLIVFLSRLPVSTTHAAVLPDEANKNIVWLSEPGPGGGGGGGGNRMKDPPKQAELPGKDKITVPVEKPPKLEVPSKVEPNPVEQLNIPAVTLAASKDSLPGAIEVGPLSLSQGSGSGGGSGTGTGSGIGSGTGSGLGAGSGGGTGGGVYHPGNGVTLPRVVREVRPQYTSDAMRAKVQGTVLLECVVNKDGSVGDVQVVRSLDSAFGLDQEAIKAAKQWRFAPGSRLGEPVSVLITIELTFTLR
jgi:protein TonB